MAKSDIYDVAISGGGMVGATLAIALDQAGFRVALIEAETDSDLLDPSFDGRASAVAFSCLRQWRALGIGAELLTSAQRIERILITEGQLPGAGAARDPSVRLELSADDLGDGAPGEPLGWMVENRRTRQALAHALARTTVTIIRPERVTGATFNQGQAELCLGNGARITARLAVGSEGRRSALREAAGIKAHRSDYRQTGVVATVQLANPHNATAWQHFTPSGPLAILPLSGDRASLVWTEETGNAEALISLPDHAFESLLARRFGDALGRPRLLGRRFGYPLSRQLLESTISDRLALVGDAAHGTHPIAGQGLNLGLKDIAALVEIVSDARDLGEDFGGPLVLQRYARWRRLDVVGAVTAADLIARVFSNDIDILRWARRGALFAAQTTPGLKRWLALEAGGALGDAPRSLTLG